VCSISADPPTVLVSVDLGSRTLAALRERGAFAVNFIGEGRSDLCLLFASKAPEKFSEVPWSPSDSGLPLLHEDALAWAECTTLQEVTVGDHVLLIALVEGGGVRPELEPPLLYYRRSWGVWSPMQEADEHEPVAIDAIEVSGRDLRWQGAEF
jgi:flavin reductase (DIM6/NTAB) family NADH-FMN oxidoreductase RutF